MPESTQNPSIESERKRSVGARHRLGFSEPAPRPPRTVGQPAALEGSELFFVMRHALARTSTCRNTSKSPRIRLKGARMPDIGGKERRHGQPGHHCCKGLARKTGESPQLHRTAPDIPGPLDRQTTRNQSSTPTVALSSQVVQLSPTWIGSTPQRLP